MNLRTPSVPVQLYFDGVEVASAELVAGSFAGVRMVVPPGAEPGPHQVTAMCGRARPDGDVEAATDLLVVGPSPPPPDLLIPALSGLTALVLLALFGRAAWKRSHDRRRRRPSGVRIIPHAGRSTAPTLRVHATGTGSTVQVVARADEDSDDTEGGSTWSR